MPISYNGPIVVVCEGDADRNLVHKLIAREALASGEFYVHSAQGYTNFARVVTAIVGSSDRPKLKRLALIGDNDTDPADRFASACTALTEEGLPIPPTPGTIAAGNPSTAVFLLPTNGIHGTLESLLMLGLLDKHPEVEECVRTLEKCPTGCGGWDEAKKAKLRFQAGVAVTCQDDPSAAAAWIWKKTHNPVDIASHAFDELAAFLVAVSVIT